MKNSPGIPAAALLFLLATLAPGLSPTPAFEGLIRATLTASGDAQTILYTVGTNALWVERTETDRPHAKNLVALDTGAVTMVYPHNRSFMRLKNSSPVVQPGSSNEPNPSLPPAGNIPVPSPAALPAPANIGPPNLPGIPALPSIPQTPALPGGAGAGMPPMPVMAMMHEPLELTATGEKTNLLGYECEKFQIKQRGEVMEVWATRALLPFQLWMQNQPPRLGPQMIEEKWGGLLRAKNLFPLRAVLRFENGSERLRFEVTCVTPQKIENKDGTRFLPPADYHELEPLPF